MALPEGINHYDTLKSSKSWPTGRKSRQAALQKSAHPYSTNVKKKSEYSDADSGSQKDAAVGSQLLVPLATG